MDKLWIVLERSAKHWMNYTERPIHWMNKEFLINSFGINIKRPVFALENEMIHRQCLHIAFTLNVPYQRPEDFELWGLHTSCVGMV